MEISKTEYKRCDLIKATGRIDSNTAPELEQAFNQVIESGKSGIVFDMDEVEFLSSRGIWVLLEAQKMCRRENGKLVLVNVNDNMHQTLDLAGVKHFVEIREDILSAVGSF
jgi:anti-sigma B factor antagonist